MIAACWQSPLNQIFWGVFSLTGVLEDPGSDIICCLLLLSLVLLIALEKVVLPSPATTLLDTADALGSQVQSSGEQESRPTSFLLNILLLSYQRSPASASYRFSIQRKRKKKFFFLTYNSISLRSKNRIVGTRLAQLGEHETPDLRDMSLRPTLGVEITF